MCLVPGAFSGQCLAGCTTESDCPTDFICQETFTVPGEFGCLPRAFDCDPKVVTCRAMMPDCPSLEVAVVEGTCWTGECVAHARCLPIPCDPDQSGTLQCPPALVCYRNSLTCGPPL